MHEEDSLEELVPSDDSALRSIQVKMLNLPNTSACLPQHLKRKRRRFGDDFTAPNTDIDPSQLQTRLLSTAPKQMSLNPLALKFSRTTKAREKRIAREQPVKLQPLPILKIFQDRNQPEFMYAKNREQLINTGWKPPSEPTIILQPTFDLGKPLKRLPELPADMTKKQIDIDTCIQPIPPSPALALCRTSSCMRMISPPELTYRTAEDVIKENIQDPLKITSIIRKNKHLGFLYMAYNAPKYSINYDFYNLSVVAYEDTNMNDYYTISQDGVLHMKSEGIDFIDLDRWEQEYLYHKKLTKIPVFALFRKWKAFTVWRKNVRSKKISNCRRALQENLFIINPSLRPALLNIRDMCYRISDISLYKIKKGHTYTLDEFKTIQSQQLSEGSERLSQFRKIAQQTVKIACCTALLEAGFIPDDYLSEIQSAEIGEPDKLHSSIAIEILTESSDKINYTGQANKRSHCRRLTCFIRLTDYLIVNTLHVLAVNSITILYNQLTEKLKHIPEDELIKIWSTNDQVKENELEQKVDIQDICHNFHRNGKTIYLK